MKFSEMTVETISRYLIKGSPTPDELEILLKDHRAGVRRLADVCRIRLIKRHAEEKRLISLQALENEARGKGYRTIAGVDEAGRGPLAGPVVAAAVILPHGYAPAGINDSKQLTPQKREELFAEISAQALAWSVGIGEVTEIDSINILAATKNAMFRAIASLAVKPDYILLDALTLGNLPCPQQGVIGGDARSASIAAASIMAKVTRDRWMCEMDKVYPGYGFAIHKGYATKGHRQAISRMGVCPMHRKSFMLQSSRWL